MLSATPTSPTPRSWPAPLRCLRRWARAREGVAAVEFAVILPTMMFMYLGMTEVTVMVGTSRKLEIAARTVGDLTGRARTMNATDMGSVMAAARAVMTPYLTQNLSIVVASVNVTRDTNTGTATGAVGWSCSWTAGAVGRGLTAGAPIPVPAGYEGAQSFILTRVEMPYRPVFGTDFLAKINPSLIDKKLGLELPWLVRDTGTVTWTGPNPSGC